MALDDRFNPNDGSLIDRIDNAMIGMHKKLGNFWQNKTYKPTDSLRKGLYGTSAIAFLAEGVMASNYPAYIPALISAIYSVTGRGSCPKSSLEAEIAAESLGLPKKTWKYINLTLYGVGTARLLQGTIAIAGGVAYGNQELIKEGVAGFRIGIGVLTWATANYLNQINLEPPPKKPKKKPVLERIKEKFGELLPQPTPEPIPVSYYAL